VCAEIQDGENQRAAEMWSLRSEEKIGLTEDFYFYACGGEEESRPRNSGDRDTKRRYLAQSTQLPHKREKLS
jgi:hypothetical protein